MTTDRYGNQTHVTTYAAQGYRAGTSTWSAPGNGSAETTTETTYDGIFHTYSEKVTSPPAVTGAAPLIELAGYNLGMGTLTSITGPNGTATTVSAEYDGFGRLVKIIKPGDTSALPTLEAVYHDYALPFRYIVAQREVSGAGGNQPTTSFYDGLGRLIQTKRETLDGAQTVVTNTEYDGMNNVVREYRPRLVDETPSTTFWNYLAPVAGLPATTTTYDARNRPLVITAPDNTRTEHHYGINEGLHSDDVLDANRHRVQQRSDVFGRLMQVIEIGGTCGNYWGYTCGTGEPVWAETTRTRYAYSPLDLLTTVTDANANVTTMGYDSLGRKRTMSDPDMGAWSYQYDPDGNLISQTDAKNQTISFGYDALSRLRSKIVPGSGTVTYTYDQTDIPKHRYGLGQRTSMTDASGTQDWAYNGRGIGNRDEYTGDGTTWVTSRTYRADEQVATLTQPTGETLTYGYNAARQQTTMATSLGGQYLTGTTYDALGQPLVESYGNGVSSTNTYYAASARLYNIIVRGPQSQLLFRRYYTYDGVGNVRTTDSPEQAETLRFGYDDRDRLTSACAVANVGSLPCVGGSTFNQSYAYNAIGNLTTKAGVAYTYPTNGVRPHAVATVAGQAYTYDANGNVLTGGGRSYTWNAENQPTQITSGATSEAYQYDGDNVRVKKTSTTGGTSITTRYVGDLEYRSDGTTITNYDGVAFRTQTGSTNVLTYVHGDHLGSVSLTTNTTGVASPLQTFDPWGAVRSGSITSTEYNYTNQRKDAGTGLLFYNARYYDPALGRFLSADSIVPGASPLTININDSDSHELFLQKSGSRGTKFPQDLNRYSYAGNNPIGRTDSTGHDWEDFKQYAAGIVEGMGALGGVIASYFDAETWKSVGRGLQLLKNDPGQAWAILREQYYDTPARGFNFLVNNPRDALSILRNNPREAGNILGTVFTGAAFAAYATKVGGCSFSADTVVTTPHGLRPISTLVVGDDVLAYNEVTGRTGSYTITAVLVHLDLTIVHLTLDGESIETTPEHPFFTEAQGWVAAGALQRDDRIRRADGTYGVVQTTSVELHQQPMYNLTVDVAHTFFVGAEQWLVHNTCNPFKGKTPIEIDDMFRKKGFGTSGPDPLNGKGGYINPKSGRSYHIDWKNSYGERPHVDVNRPRTYKGPLEKRKYPIN